MRSAFRRLLATKTSSPQILFEELPALRERSCLPEYLGDPALLWHRRALRRRPLLRLLVVLPDRPLLWLLQGLWSRMVPLDRPLLWLRLVLLPRSLLLLRQGPLRRLVLLGLPPLSLRRVLWRLWVLLLQDLLAGLERLGVLWDLVLRARRLHLSGSRRW